MDVKQKRQCGNNWCNVNCTGGKDCDCSLEKNNAQIDTEEIILIEGFSKKSNDNLAGRTDGNKVVIIPFDDKIKPGSYVKVKINRATSGTLFGDFIDFYDVKSDFAFTV